MVTMKKSILTALVCLCAVVLSAGGSSDPAGFTFARSGRACARIVTNPRAGSLEKMAADDLKKFLEEATGAKFAVVTEDAAKKSPASTIYLGNTKFAAKNGFPQSSLKDEEWVLKTVGRDLIITGGVPVGTFYGVWALLNKLGIYVLTAEQNAVPSLPDCKIGPLDVRRQPEFVGRMIFMYDQTIQSRDRVPESMKEKLRLFNLRAGINQQETRRIEPYYIGRFYKLAARLAPLGAHSLCKFVDPAKLFKTHPEYFSMNEKGKRFSPLPPNYLKAGSVCMSNPEVARITLESLREMIKKDRAEKKPEDWAYIYPITTLDNMKYICKCPKCTAISREEESEAGLYLRYINTVAEAIAKEYPDVLIKISAYSAARKAPKIVRPAKNVLVSFPDNFTKSDPFRPLTHPINAEQLREFESWKKISPRFMVSDYWNIGMKYFVPPRVEVMLDAIKPDFDFFKKNGIIAVFIEDEREFVTPQPFFDLQAFLGTHLLMDLDRDVEKLIDIFLKYYYGEKAAPVMRAFLDEIREGVRKQPNRQTTLSVRRWRYWNGKFAVRNYLMLKKAAAMYPEGSPYRERIEENMISLIWLSLLHRREFAPEFKRAGIEPKALTAECKRFVERFIHRWGAKRPRKTLASYRHRWETIERNIPRPEKFKDVPEEDIRIAGAEFANPAGIMKSAVVSDPESVVGKAMRCFGPSGEYHHAGKVKLTSGLRMSPRKFCLSADNGVEKKSISMILKDSDIPRDEKYHWYKLPGALDIAERTWFWGLCWGIQFRMSSFYILGDGVADNNRWECWFSAKFTGPAYVPGSQKENAVWVDLVVLTRGKSKDDSK